MPNPLTFVTFLTLISLGQSLLTASLLFSRTSKSQIHTSLVLFFCVMSASFISSVLDAPSLHMLPKSINHFVSGATISTDLLLLPLFWFYVRGVTSETEVKWSKNDLLHLLPFGLSLFLFVTLLVTPYDDRLALFDKGRDKDSLIQTFLFIAIISAYVVWLFQWILYAIAIIKRLVVYRARLRDLFATTDKLELRWIGWLGILILVNWCWVASVFLFDVFTNISLFEEPWISLLDLALVWTLSIWGLRQTRVLALEVAETQKVTNKNPRYENSALSDEQKQNVANKINDAMIHDKLYRLSDLSLSKFSTHIHTRPDYLSQTLNTFLHVTFFDYINKWRIEEAKRLLKDTKKTVLEIALDVGFNSRSSFYSAFKRYTGITPIAWRRGNN